MDGTFDLSVSIPILLVRLGCAIALGAVIAWRPLARRTLKIEVRQALLIMTIAAAMVVVVIGDSLARAFGIVGLGSFIRFRTAIKDPRDVVHFFLAIGTGMACGLGAVPVASAGVAVVWATLVVLERWVAPEPADGDDPVPAPASTAAGAREKRALVEGRI